MARNPLARALRLDKLCLAALDWTLACFLEGRAEREIPVLRQLLEPAQSLEARARDLTERLAAAAGSENPVLTQPDRALVGGGSLPGFELDTWVIALRPKMGADRFAARLRAAEPPVLARVRDDLVLFDVRTLLEGEDAVVEKVVVAILGAQAR
jgi:L-seryl-tRNA(Ser) seleniumtransferase